MSIHSFHKHLLIEYILCAQITFWKTETVESGRVVGFCSYGVYIILMEEKSDSRVNKSSIVSESKSNNGN